MDKVKKEFRGADPFPSTGQKFEPTHPCNTVPAEMHTQMINERDKEIKILRGMTDKEGHHICSHGQCCACLKEPQPVREGWWVKFVFLGFGFFAMGLISWNYETPATPKGTVDATPEVNILAMEQNYVKLESDLWKSIRERDHWLRNDQAAYRALDCGGNSFKVHDKNACEALNR